ncbi:MAG: quinone-dependent dihydroorotate dehydrogenase [Deinococcus sp.]|nr:quinone-dependent dihydroorotate dehydrogenase [Deinococcus sp.]
MYSLARPLLFREDPETIHERVLAGLAWAGRHPALLRVIGAICQLRDDRLAVERFGLRFPNPVGLAAGFDKNALAVPAWPALGFGFVEIGSVTAVGQQGNPRPRLFRLPEDYALINRMGFNNDGADAVAARLELLQRRFGALPVPVGINLGKSQAVPLDTAALDYLASCSKLWPYAGYFAINVSSPNTPGLRELQDKDKLQQLLAGLTGYAKERGQGEGKAKPILLKIAPDLTWPQLDEILALCEQYRVSGIIATNTTVSRQGLRTQCDQAGGLSGRPLARRSVEILKYLSKASGGKLPIISVGGVFTVQDVIERFAAGASLIQVYTGFVYQGPTFVKKLNVGLLRYMERVGVKRVGELVGSGGSIPQSP